MTAAHSLAAFAALASLACSEIAMAADAPCLSEHEVTSLVTYALPVVMDSAIKTCRPQLAPGGYFATQGAALVQRYAAHKSMAWPEAKRALLKIGGNDDKMKDMVASLSDEALQPFAEGLVAQLVTKGIKPKQCIAIERATRLLSPLPPENTAELLTFVIVLAERPKLRSAVGAPRNSELPICPA
jgi:hypothetical protein